jgi:hypothetical protein
MRDAWKRKSKVERPRQNNILLNQRIQILRWVLDGWIEIGYESDTDSFVRALDEGGMVWQGKRKYPTLEDALKDLNRGVAKWFEEND